MLEPCNPLSPEQLLALPPERLVGHFLVLQGAHYRIEDRMADGSFPLRNVASHLSLNVLRLADKSFVVEGHVRPVEPHATIAACMEEAAAAPHERATSLYRQVLTTNPHHTEAMAALARRLAQVGDAEQPWFLMVRAVEVEPNVERYLADCMAYAAAVGRVRAAAETFARMKRLFRHSSPCDGVGIRLLLKVGLLQAAQDCLRWLPPLLHPDLHQMVAVAVSHSEQSAGLRRQAWAARSHGDHDSARRLLTQAVEIHPDDFFARGNLALLDLDAGKPDVALTGLSPLTALVPPGYRPSLYVTLALALARTGQVAKALLSFGEVHTMRRDGDIPGPLLWLQEGGTLEMPPGQVIPEIEAWLEVAAAQKLAVPEGARHLLALYRKPLHLQDWRPDFDRRCQRAREHLAAGHHAEAEREAMAALRDTEIHRASPHLQADALYLLARVNTGRHGPVEASIKLLRRVLEVAPTDWPDRPAVMQDLCVLLGAADEFAESIELGRRLLAMLQSTRAPEDAGVVRAREAVGVALSRSGALEEAEKELLEVLAWYQRHRPTDSFEVCLAVYNLGGLYQRMKRHDASLECIQRAQVGFDRLPEDDPQHWSYRLKLASALAWVGRNAEVEALFQQGISEAERVFGRHHQETARAHQDYAAWLGNVGRAAESRQHHEQSQAIVKHLLGER